MNRKKRNNSGQAMVEYLVILIFVASIGIGLIKGLNSFLTTSFGGLGRALNNHLSTGECPTGCLFTGYKNR